jgi:hypothetical protein
MAFIRKKTINGTDYAYLVKNRWTDKGSRQKAKYLGKLVEFEVVNDFEFVCYIKNRFKIDILQFFRKRKVDILDGIIQYELMKRGFKLGERKILGEKQNVLNSGKFYYKNRQVLKVSNNKEVVAEMNEGFLCSYALKKLLKLSPGGYDEREKGIVLAKALLEAGLNVEKEMFVHFFERWTELKD